MLRAEVKNSASEESTAMLDGDPLGKEQSFDDNKLGNIFETQQGSYVRGKVQCVVCDADFVADFRHDEDHSNLENQPCLFDPELEEVGKCSGKGKKIKPLWACKERIS